MKMITVDEIIELHNMMTKMTGGCSGLRDKALLESAVMSACSGFGDIELYPSVEEKAARIMFSLVSNHAFVDGNKRIGLLAMLVILEFNGIMLEYTQAELIELDLSLASGKYGYDEILDFINTHKKSEAEG